MKDDDKVRSGMKNKVQVTMAEVLPDSVAAKQVEKKMQPGTNNNRNSLFQYFKLTIMSNEKKGHAGREGNDGSETKNKGESQQSHQQGAKSVSHQDTGRHTKDKSHGVDHNSTKKGANSI